jgi:coenzyme F420-reducing hydrogenase beta subunit
MPSKIALPEVKAVYKPDITRLGKHECTGCSACENVCPHGYVRLEENEEGFLYPSVDLQCMGCGACDKVCPILTYQTEIGPEIEQYAVAAVSHDRATCQASSSGGAFTEICKAYGDDQTIIFGARLDGARVIHSYVIGSDNIGPFRKSKYVQSETGKSFSLAKQFLEEGRKVIFSGTPCQLAGLKAFLKKNYERLLCIDFICHGVGSPGVFGDSWRHIEQKNGKKLTQYSFRHRVGWMGNSKDYVCQYTFEDGERVCAFSDPYQKFFLSQLCLRESCGENCKFRNPNRLSDITIADFKGKYKVFPTMMDHRNYSTIIVNTHKGDDIFNLLKLSMKTIPCKLSDIEKFNPLFFKTTKENSDRARFFKEFVETKDFECLKKTFIPQCSFFKKHGWIRHFFIPFHFKRLVRILIDKRLIF